MPKKKQRDEATNTFTRDIQSEQIFCGKFKGRKEGGAELCISYKNFKKRLYTIYVAAVRPSHLLISHYRKVWP